MGAAPGKPTFPVMGVNGIADRGVAIAAAGARALLAAPGTGVSDVGAWPRACAEDGALQLRRDKSPLEQHEPTNAHES